MPSIDPHLNPNSSVAPDTVAAFFDVDNTLVRGASLYLLARKLHERRFFQFREILWFALKQLRFAARGEHLGDIHQIRDRALMMVRGIPVSEIEKIGNEIYDEYIEPKLWAGSVAIARQHRTVGREVWLVTATPGSGECHLRSFGTYRCFGHGSGQRGRFLHRIAVQPDPACGGKGSGGTHPGQGSRHLAIKSWAYSDSYNDVPLLEAVGHPVCINPDARLRAYAKRRGWQVYDFRTGQRAAKLGLKTAGVLGALWAARRSILRRSGS